MSLSLIDLMIVGIPCAVVFGVALFMRRYLRSVADFLAASRCAGRYVICTAVAETGAWGMGFISWLEAFSKTGFSLSLWSTFSGFVYFILGLIGFVVYRYRQTRALTFHQFFEVRYSRGVRVLASFLNVFSGLFSFGIAPAACARFFVYFLGMPEHTFIAGLHVPTFMILMTLFIGASLYLTLSGGQISVMVTDCLEGLISGVFYLVVSFTILALVSHAQVEKALLAGPPGKSLINPFDIGKQPDFNGWFVVIGLLMNLYYYRGSGWSQGFVAAAKSPHESKMAGILGMWRQFAGVVMGGLVSVGALTLLNHPAFADKAAAVQQQLSRISNPQLQTQLRMPLALGMLLPIGAKGAFLAIALFGLVAGMGSAMLNFGSTVIQDVVLPFRKTAFEPQQHIRILRWAVIGIGVFALLFSAIYKPVDYLTMILALFGAIYLGGIGAPTLGGLYWKKGTTQGAYTSLITGATVALLGQLLQQGWTWIAPHLAQLAGPGPCAEYLTAHAARCPLNGQILAFISVFCAGSSYVVVSLITCKQNYDMDRLLHRGKYAVASDVQLQQPAVRGRFWWLAKFIGIDEQYTRGDKFLAWGMFSWSAFWQILAVIILAWNLFLKRWSDHWWFNYTWATGIILPLAIGVATTVWFTFGGTIDLFRLLKALRLVKPDHSDDGRVLHEPAAR